MILVVKTDNAPNKHLAPYITPHLDTTFHSIINSCLNRGAHCLASNREKYENSMDLEVEMAVLGRNPCHIDEFISYIKTSDFLYT